MVLKQKRGYFDGVCGVVRSTAMPHNEYIELLDEDGMDVDYRLYLEGPAKQKNLESKRKQREVKEPDYSLHREEEIDPQYELFLRRLREHGKSYILISLERDENGKFIKYEGDSISDTESDQELRRKEQRHGPSRQMPSVENQSNLDSQSTPSTDIERLTRRQTRSQSRSEMERNAKLLTKNPMPLSAYRRSTPVLKGHSSLNKDSDPEPERMLRSGRKLRSECSDQIRDLRKDDSPSTAMKEMEKSTMRNLKSKLKREKEDKIIQLDLDYQMFCQNLKVVNNHCYAYDDSVHRVVYGQKGGWSSNQVKEEYDDGSYSDVEILDSATFYKMNKSGISDHKKSTEDCEFRQKVIAALRKPFDKEELENLWHEIKVRKPEVRHLDLRHGRERSYAKQKDGKSYLDRCPDLRKKLKEVQDDKPKRLNLLRGFFLWLKQPDGFFPWLDKECLAIYPESG